jgi:hypothetical protein
MFKHLLLYKEIFLRGKGTYATHLGIVKLLLLSECAGTVALSDSYNFSRFLSKHSDTLTDYEAMEQPSMQTLFLIIHLLLRAYSKLLIWLRTLTVVKY